MAKNAQNLHIDKKEIVETADATPKVEKAVKPAKTIKIKATSLIASPYCTLFKGAVAEVPEDFANACIKSGIAEKA